MKQKIPTKLFPKDLVVLSELQPIDVMIRDIENHKTTDETSKKEVDKKVISPSCLRMTGKQPYLPGRILLEVIPTGFVL